MFVGLEGKVVYIHFAIVYILYIDPYGYISILDILITQHGARESDAPKSDHGVIRTFQ